LRISQANCRELHGVAPGSIGDNAAVTLPWSVRSALISAAEKGSSPGERKRHAARSCRPTVDHTDDDKINSKSASDGGKIADHRRGAERPEPEQAQSTE
jgi:hypothetical protein